MTKITGYSYLPRIYQNPATDQKIQIFLPMIPIRISFNHSQTSPLFDALIDSGSDRNLFPLAFVKYLGLNVDNIKPNKIYGIGKGYIEGYPFKINIWLGTTKHITEADFSSQQQMPILGRFGFFNLFKSVKFDEKGQFVYIEE